uniref:Putative LAGLIDADG homing endonuclease n=2 Tax=Ignatiaceae TaxID=2682551 RepID=A0A1W6EGZ5_9CHLO|nr:putative LAGLIDADG homing endonuclease [Pseudocharacium americanum]YP_009367688.1 putative LAGLIDADG homing endonuclease [Ignatius tetrasporus]ARK14625.1 putative LAGLIDADG homing endonuclease [Pseudocharacium americanum]ARK14716.1 putative LAGLIDADG homing endonuclease [Ignatius tetrasporus]
MNYSNFETKWNQWLAGVIDGDGYLAIQKTNKVAVCEITMPLNDEQLLAQIKQKLGGNIGLRSGAKAVRYRLTHQEGIRELIHRINGSIRNSQRVPQFQKLCDKFNIPFLPAPTLTSISGYSAGFFDADGTVCLITRTNLPEFSIQKGTLGKINRLYYSRGGNQLQISISNKYLENVAIFYDAFQLGKIRQVKQQTKTWYSWELTTETQILSFCDYLRKIPSRSVKSQRIFLIERYFELKKMKAHLAPQGTNLNQAWLSFCQKWYLG